MKRLMRMTLVVLLVTSTGFLPAPAFASDFAAAVSKAASEAAAAQQARPNARSNDDNRYFVPSMVLLGAGGLVALYGLTHYNGVECSDTRYSIRCEATRNNATIFTGLGMAAAGAYLFHKGRAENNLQVLAGPHVIGVRQHVTW